MMTFLATLPAFVVVDALGPMMPITHAIAALPCAIVSEDVTVVLFDADLDGAFVDVSPRINKFADIVLTCGRDLNVSGRAAGIGGLRHLCYRDYGYDFDSKGFQELLVHLVTEARQDSE